MQSHVAIAHLAIELRLGNQRCHRIHHHDIHRAGGNQGVGNFQRLLAVVRLRNKQIVHIHAELPRIARIKGVFGVDEGRRSAHLLRFGDHLQGECGFAGRLRPENLHYAPSREAAHT